MLFIRKFVRDMLTEDDGKSYCVGRVMASIAFIEATVQFSRVELANIVSSMQPYAISVCALIAAVAVKNMSERSGKPFIGDDA
jgi:hypothetical protein